MSARPLHPWLLVCPARGGGDCGKLGHCGVIVEVPIAVVALWNSSARVERFARPKASVLVPRDNNSGRMVGMGGVVRVK